MFIIILTIISPTSLDLASNPSYLHEEFFSGFSSQFGVREKYHLIALFPRSDYLLMDWWTGLQQNEDMRFTESTSSKR